MGTVGRIKEFSQAKLTLVRGIVHALCYWLCRLCLAISGIVPYSLQVDARIHWALRGLNMSCLQRAMNSHISRRQIA